MKDKHSLLLLINNTFKYHAPCEETAPKYKALREAERKMQMVCTTLRAWTFEQHNSYDSINEQCKAFAGALLEHCPDGADIEPLVLQIGLVRNLMNEALNIRKTEAEEARRGGTAVPPAGAWAGDLLRDAKLMLCKTRMMACALIALEKAARDRAQGIRIP